MITVYSKNDCPNCVNSLALLDQLGIAYEVRKVDEDFEAADFILKEQHRSVPQFYKNGKLLIKGGHQGLLKAWRDGTI